MTAATRSSEASPAPSGARARRERSLGTGSDRPAPSRPTEVRPPSALAPPRAARARERIRWSGQSGRAIPWLLFAVLALGSVWLVQRLQRDVRAEGFHRVEPARIRIDPAGGAEVWFDRRWSRELELTLASFPPFDLDDADARARLTDALAALSFVAEVGEASGVWPDGLRLPLRPHVPVAVVLAGNRYLAVAPDGTVLSGAWPAPPRRDGGWLPVLGPNDGAFERARPGDVLVERRHLDALSVACSLWRHLDPLTEVRLGRARIDGSEEPVASPTDPGVVLWLEGGRQIWFGRPACTDEPGELPVEAKWRHLSAGLEQVAVTGADWIALDVRWDRPEVRLAEGAESALTASGAGEAVR